MGILNPPISRGLKVNQVKMSLQYHLSDGLNVLLDKIKFVDRIVFGRLHYNKLVSSYKEYYNECASIIMDFCKRNNIDCHIKNKTITKE